MVACEHLRRQIGRKLVYGHAMVGVAAKDLWGLIQQRRSCHRHLEAVVYVIHRDELCRGLLMIENFLLLIAATTASFSSAVKAALQFFVLTDDKK